MPLGIALCGTQLKTLESTWFLLAFAGGAQLASAGAITHRPTEFGKLTEAINTAMSQSIATNITYLMPAWLLDRLSQSVVSAPLR